MKQFSLEEYLKNPSRQVVTRNGRPVRILCTDRIDKENGYVIVGLVPNSDTVPSQGVSIWKATGESVITKANDLFFAPVKQEGYVNVFDFASSGARTDECVYDTFEEAVSFAKKNPDSKYYKATVKIEWEE